MLSPVKFGAIQQVFGPYKQTTKPQNVIDVENQAQIHMTTGPVDGVDWAPPPAEGGACVSVWTVHTDEDALVLAKNAGIGVSVAKTPAENQALIDAFVSKPTCC